MQSRIERAAWSTSFKGGALSQTALLKELWAFMKVRKKWWLLPVIIVLLLVGTLLVFAQSSALAPFIYSLF
jgi:hypothetical protein